MSLSCTVSEVLLFPKIYRRHMTVTTPIQATTILMLIRHMTNQCKKFGVALAISKIFRG